VRAHGGGEDIERDRIQTLEPYAALSHVELLAGAGEAGGDLLRDGAPVDGAHDVERVEALLRGKPEVGEGELVVRLGVARQRNLVADHPPADHFVEARGKVGDDEVTEGGDDVPAFRGKGAEVALDGVGIDAHGGDASADRWWWVVYGVPKERVRSRHLRPTTAMATSVLSSSVGAATRAEPRDIPLHLAAVILGATSILIGIIWDISWHMTIGRDTFWTPAHMAIYLGGTLAGVSCGTRVLINSFFRPDGHEADGVRVWKYFTGPLGGWICIWGALAMLTSAPFDDWWHSAYGLDVQILSPPHSLLALGMFAIAMGAQVMAVSAQNTQGESTARSFVVSFAGGVMLTFAAILTSEYNYLEAQHSSTFYLIASFIYVLAIVSSARSSRLPWPATTSAAVYTVIMAAQVWIFPLFPATPKLGPIGHEVTHMVPLSFPMLLIVPAFAIDLVIKRYGDWSPWKLAALLGVTFVGVFVAVQWPFASLLATEVGRHPFFGGSYADYSTPAEWLVGPRGFNGEEGGVFTTAWKVAVFGTALATLASRWGLARGSWLRQVQR
jgi:hypothetical protein